MQLDAQVRRLVLAALQAAGPPGAAIGSAVHSDGSRLEADARRLWKRTRTFIHMGLVRSPPDFEAMELACYGLQLPMRRGEQVPVGRLGISSLRERTERAAQRLVEELGERIEDGLLDRTCRLLHETPHRPPVLEEAKLLADAINLDDFGVIGAMTQAAELALRGEGAASLAESWHKRCEYGYWSARLADGFHFPAVRRIARRRLDNARRVFEMLDEEREEDG